MSDNRTILLIEDDLVDIMTVKRAVQELRIKNPLKVARNGEEGLNYLNHHEHSLPFIILLDINMPRMNGIEFLKIVKQNAKFRTIPIIVLTTSKEDQDRYDSFNLGISGYMVKPVDYQQFVNLIDTINNYWSLSELP